MKKEKILELLEKQRQYFIRDASYNKIITNPIMYNFLEDKIVREEKKIGRENKKRLIARCIEMGWKIPNWRKEGIKK